MHFDNILSNKSDDILPLSTAVVSSFGVHTDTFLVTAIVPFLSLSVSLSVVHTDFCTTKKNYISYHNGDNHTSQRDFREKNPHFTEKFVDYIINLSGKLYVLVSKSYILMIIKYMAFESEVFKVLRSRCRDHI